MDMNKSILPRTARRMAWGNLVFVTLLLIIANVAVVADPADPHPWRNQVILAPFELLLLVYWVLYLDRLTTKHRVSKFIRKWANR